MKLKKIVKCFDVDSETIETDARKFHEQLGELLKKIPSEHDTFIELYSYNESQDGNLRISYERFETDFEEQERIKRNEQINLRRLVEQQRKVENVLKELARLKSLYEV